MKKPVKAGDKIRDAITASWFNEQNKRRNPAPQPFSGDLPENAIKVPCHADTGIDLGRFEAANIVGPAIPYEDFDGDAVQYSTAAVKVNDTLVTERWGIVQGPCLPDNPSWLVVAGITWAIFDYTEGDNYVDVVDGVLESTSSGRALILSPPESAGKPGLILIQVTLPPRIKLRVSGLNWQISYDNEETWETWATGEECV